MQSYIVFRIIFVYFKQIITKSEMFWLSKNM